MKSLNVLYSAGWTKSSKFERVTIVQTHADDGGNGRGFFLFFQKKAAFFLEKIKKILHFPHHRRVFEQS